MIIWTHEARRCVSAEHLGWGGGCRLRRVWWDHSAQEPCSHGQPVPAWRERCSPGGWLLYGQVGPCGREQGGWSFGFSSRGPSLESETSSRAAREAGPVPMGQETTELVLLGDTDHVPAPVPGLCWGCKRRAFCSLWTSVGGMEPPGDADAGLEPEQTLQRGRGARLGRARGLQSGSAQAYGVWRVWKFPWELWISVGDGERGRQVPPALYFLFFKGSVSFLLGSS